MSTRVNYSGTISGKICYTTDTIPAEAGNVVLVVIDAPDNLDKIKDGARCLLQVEIPEPPKPC